MERRGWGRINELFEAARRLPVEEREAWVRAATADEGTRAEVLALLHSHEDDPWFVDEPSRPGFAPAGHAPAPSGSGFAPSGYTPAPSGSGSALSEPKSALTHPATWPAPSESRLAPAESRPTPSGSQPTRTPSESRPAPAQSRPTPSGSQPTRTPSESRPAPSEPKPAPPWTPTTPRAQSVDLAAGSLFASYRTVREIGRGSTGVVYEAVGEGPGLHPRVTLRILPGEWSTPALADRFFAECNLLARLNHPWIAPLIDGGVADDGTPYLVTEHVAGEGIDTWCRDRDLDRRERVRLVLRVCAALEHAHQHLVLHRDLSPRNIVVSSDGQPTLLNCGIAKLRIEGLADGDGPADTGHAPTTPGYASPEEARGEPLTTASDVYSLGVILYLLLTDHPPYEVAGLSAKARLDVICHAEPALPSRVVPATERRALETDLDHILLKAIRKDPRARYHSVPALAADLRAWLDSRPVSASPSTHRYHARKLVGRHKMAALTVAAVMLAGAGGGSAMGWQAYVMRLERDRTQSRLREAVRASSLLQLELHDSMRSLPGSTSARQLLLGRASETIDALATAAGDTRALGLELAEAYWSLGHLQERSASETPETRAPALKSYERAVTFGEQALAAEPRSVTTAILLAGAYGDLASARLGAGDREAADRADARHRSLVEQLARDHPGDVRARVAIASGHGRLGAYRGANEDWAGAKAQYDNAVTWFEGLTGEAGVAADVRRDYSRTQQQYGAILLREGTLDDAERLYLSAQALDKEDATRNVQDRALRLDLAGSTSALGLIARRRGDAAKAESLWTQALVATQAALDADPKDTRALEGAVELRASLASACRSQRRFEEALLHSREALRLRERATVPGAEPPAAGVSLAVARTNVAQVLLDLVEVRPPGPDDAARLREASALLARAWPVARSVAASSPAQQGTAAEVERQTARLRRLASTRQ